VQTRRLSGRSVPDPDVQVSGPPELRCERGCTNQQPTWVLVCSGRWQLLHQLGSWISGGQPRYLGHGWVGRALGINAA
jgi:hypothetical protein